MGPFIASYLVKFLGYENCFKFDILIICSALLLIVNTEWPKTVEFNFFDYLKDFNLKSLMFIILTFIFFSHYGVEQAVYTLFMKSNVNLNEMQIGRLFVILGIWITFVTIITGKYSTTKLIVLVYAIGIFLSGAFQLFTGYTQTYIPFIIMRILHTCGDAVCSLMLGVLITYVFNKKRLGFNFGFFLIAQLLASIPFTYLSGAIVTNQNYTAPFYYNGIFMIFGSFALIIFRKRIRRIFGID